jgi:hypothetical protein
MGGANVGTQGMRLSKASYFADFAVYPPVVLMLLLIALWHAALLVWIEWFISCLAGIVAIGAFIRARISITGSGATRCTITPATRATSA